MFFCVPTLIDEYLQYLYYHRYLKSTTEFYKHSFIVSYVWNKQIVPFLQYLDSILLPSIEIGVDAFDLV